MSGVVLFFQNSVNTPLAFEAQSQKPMALKADASENYAPVVIEEAANGEVSLEAAKNESSKSKEKTFLETNLKYDSKRPISNNIVFGNESIEAQKGIGIMEPLETLPLKEITFQERKNDDVYPLVSEKNAKASFLASKTFFVENQVGPEEFLSSPVNVFTTLRKESFINELAIHGGIGYHPSISEKDCSDLEKGSPILDQYLGLSFKRIIQDEFFLFFNLNYVWQNQKINAVENTSERIYINMDEVQLRNSKTTYELYYQFQRLDFTIGGGKTWHLSPFELSAHLGLGVALWTQIDGNYLDEQFVLQALEPASSLSPAVFGMASFSIRKEWIKNTFVGLRLSVQSPLKYDQGVRNCSYSVLPLLGGVSVGKRF